MSKKTDDILGRQGRLLEEKFERILLATELRQINDSLNADLYLVGGTVRDVIAGFPQRRDFDLAVNLDPPEIVKRLNEGGIHTVLTGIKHHTVLAVFPESALSVEITSLRSRNKDGKIVVGTSIVEDLNLRDFTVNAIAYSIREKKLLDPLSGCSDISLGVIHACGDPFERIKEDPLRALRAVRLASTLKFTISKETMDAVKLSSSLLSLVSQERVRDELAKILVGSYPRMGLELLHKLDLLSLTIPELIPCIGCVQNRFHSKDVFFHTLDVVEKTRADLILRLGALFHDIGKPHTISIDEETRERHFYKHETVGADITHQALQRLKFSNEIVDSVTTLVRLHMRPTDCGAPGMRRLLRDTCELYPLWRELKEVDTLSTNINAVEFLTHIKEFDEKIAIIKKGPELSAISALAIRGADLLALGMKQSPKIGVILRALHEKVLDDPSLNTPESLIRLVKEDFNEI